MGRDIIHLEILTDHEIDFEYPIRFSVQTVLQRMILTKLPSTVISPNAANAPLWLPWSSMLVDVKSKNSMLKKPGPKVLVDLSVPAARFAENISLPPDCLNNPLLVLIIPFGCIDGDIAEIIIDKGYGGRRKE
jgi:hypothetical protein